MSTERRYRLVVLGAPGVGKTSIVRRYLYNEMPHGYAETVEDLHSRDLNIAGVKLPLDIVDTGFHYPDMRRLSMATADAFLLVYAVDDVQSFRDMSDLWDEIASTRKRDLPTLPVVVVGNKHDITTNVKIKSGMTEAWLRTRRNIDKEKGARICFVPASALDKHGILTIFRTLLCMSQFANKHNVKTKTPNALDNKDEPLVDYPDFTIRTLPSEPPRRQSLVRTNSQPDPEACDAARSSKPESGSFRHRSMRRGKNAERSLCQSMQAVEMGNGSPTPTSTPKLIRAGSLLMRGVSLRRKQKPVRDEKDESDCKIS